MAYEFVFWAFLAFVIGFAGLKLIRDKSNTKYKFKAFVKSKKFLGMGAILLFMMGTPINPINDMWIWEYLGIGWNPVGPADGGHLAFNNEKIWTGLNGKFTIKDGLNADGNFPSTVVGSATGAIYKYQSIGAMSKGNLGYEKLWTENKISFEDYMALSDLVLIESFTASSGVVTMTTNQLTSGDIVLIRIGTYNVAEDGDSPLKSLFWKAVVQGCNGDTKPTTVNIGTGVFYYWQFPDEDDMALDMLTDTYGAIGADTLDWSDDADKKFDLIAKLTFTDDDCLLSSYYDQVNKRWYNWVYLLELIEDNCTTSEAIIVTSSYTTENWIGTSQQNIILQLSSPQVYTSNVRPSGIGYLKDTAGVVITGFEAIQYIKFRIDLTSATAVGSDNYVNIQMNAYIGTTWSNSMSLLAGDVPADVDNNYDKAGAATEYIVA